MMVCSHVSVSFVGGRWCCAITVEGMSATA